MIVFLLIVYLLILFLVPASYGNSGVMTFVVNQDGVVFERDLGPESARIAAEMNAFDPDDSWRRIGSD